MWIRPICRRWQNGKKDRKDIASDRFAGVGKVILRSTGLKEYLAVNTLDADTLYRLSFIVQQKCIPVEYDRLLRIFYYRKDVPAFLALSV